MTFCCLSYFVLLFCSEPFLLVTWDGSCCTSQLFSSLGLCITRPSCSVKLMELDMSSESTQEFVSKFVFFLFLWSATTKKLFQFNKLYMHINLVVCTLCWTSSLGLTYKKTIIKHDGYLRNMKVWLENWMRWWKKINTTYHKLLKELKMKPERNYCISMSTNFNSPRNKNLRNLNWTNQRNRIGITCSKSVSQDSSVVTTSKMNTSLVRYTVVPYVQNTLYYY